MAKELPYFKFEPNQWENGNIQMCNKESKGLFIDLCSIYWSRLGELPYALALQKHCNGDKDALQQLIDCNIIGLENDQIIIQFLDEQLNEFHETSEKRRKAANDRWNKTSAMQVHSKSNAIREEKRREEKISIPPTIEVIISHIEDKTKLKDNRVKKHAEYFYNFYDSKGWKVGKNKMTNWKSACTKSLSWDNAPIKEKLNNNGYANTHIDTNSMFGDVPKK